MTRRVFAVAALGVSATIACSAAPGPDSASLGEQVTGSGLEVTQNTYDGSEYWGTITIKNAGASSVTGFDVAFSIPSGDHCTNDSVPSGAVLSPLSGSGSSAETSSNHCTFTWAKTTLKAGASLTFNYSTDNTNFSSATNVVASATGSSGSGSSSGGSSSGSSSGSKSGSSSGSTSGSSSGGGTETCGCNGQSGCAQWTEVYITWYGFNDNSCTTESQHDCDDIAYPGLGPQKHQVATEGAGTYDDPITAAASDQGWETAGGATLEPGTLIYNPEVKKYFIMEDSCLECGDEWKCHLSSDDTDDPNPPSGCKAGTYKHIDFWMGPDFQQTASSLNDCEDNSTIGNPYDGPGTVLINPPPGLPVVTTKLYTGSGSNGGCWTSSQVNNDSCP